MSDIIIDEPNVNHKIQDDAIDVLEEHRTRNHAIRPPNLDTLVNAVLEGQQENEESDEEEEESSTQRARRHSKTPMGAEPKVTMMKYYPQGWKNMLEMAKNNMRRHVALVNAFPRRDRDLKEATS